MKKAVIIAVAAVSLAVLPVGRAFAGDKEWAAAGKILTGVIGLSIIADAIGECAEPYSVYGSYRYRSARDWRGDDRCDRSRRRHHSRKYHRREYRKCSRGRTWVPGHYRIVREKVWVPASNRKVWVPACYEWRYRRGRKVRVCVRDGYYRYEQVPGHYEWVKNKVWVEGCWQQVA